VTLLIFKTDLNIYSMVGVVMLIGIVKKNAIMMIDFALDAQRNQGKNPRMMPSTKVASSGSVPS